MRPARILPFLARGVVDILVSFKDQSNAEGITPLMGAALVGFEQGVAELMRRGANPTLEDNKGRIALDFLTSNGPLEERLATYTAAFTLDQSTARPSFDPPRLRL